MPGTVQLRRDMYHQLGPLCSTTDHYACKLHRSLARSTNRMVDRIVLRCALVQCILINEYSTHYRDSTVLAFSSVQRIGGGSAMVCQVENLKEK